jgi:hypothetical protein
LKDVLKVVKNYEYGDSRNWLQHYHDVMAKVHNDADAKIEAEKLIVGILDSEASYAAKSLLCSTLGIVGGKAFSAGVRKITHQPLRHHICVDRAYTNAFG